MLKPFFRTIEEDMEDYILSMEREKLLRHKIETSFPQDVDAEVSYDPIGKSCIRAFIHLDKNVSSENTEKCKHFLVSIFGKAERDFRENTGTFMWKSRKEIIDGEDKYEELVFIENANPGQCKIIPVQKTVTVYETDCKPEDK